MEAQLSEAVLWVAGRGNRTCVEESDYDERSVRRDHQASAAVIALSAS